jgi:hypothetical protein
LCSLEPVRCFRSVQARTHELAAYTRNMTKTYLTGWTRSKRPGEEHKSDFAFDPDREKAASWFSKEEAIADFKVLNTMTVEVTSPDGLKHFCKDFEVEEMDPSQVRRV